MTWPKNSTASSSVVVFRRPAGLRRASGIGRRATLRRASGACRLARLMLAGGAPFGDGLVCRGPVGGGHLAEHDPDAGRVGADRRDHGRVQPVDQVAQQVGRAALDQRDLHEGHHRLPRNTEPRLVAVKVDCDSVHQQLVDRRGRLIGHVERVHSKREPTGLSVYEMQGKLLRLGSAAKTPIRWRGGGLDQLTTEVAERVRDLLLEASGFESLFLRTDPSPWTGAKLPNGEAVQRALDLVSRATEITFPAFAGSLRIVLGQCRLQWPTSVGAARELVELIASVQTTLAKYSADVYVQDLPSLRRDLGKGAAGGLSGAWAWITDAAYRRARKTALALRTAGFAHVRVLCAEMKEAQQQRDKWKALG